LGSGDLKEPLEGKFANFFRVGHNVYEFVIEFGQVYQAEEEPRMHTRIVTSPAYAHELVEILQRALREYELAVKDRPR
jgi:hypothetical protein